MRYPGQCRRLSRNSVCIAARLRAEARYALGCAPIVAIHLDDGNILPSGFYSIFYNALGSNNAVLHSPFF
jgi:hypothetical protein